MQTALGSLRSAGPSKGVKTDEGSTFWGIGAEGLTFTGNYRFRIVKGTISICGITLAAQQLQPWYDVSAAVAPYPTFKSAHLQSNSSNSEIELPNGLEKFPSIIEVTVCEEFMPNLRDLAPQHRGGMLKLDTRKGLLLWDPKIQVKVVSVVTWSTSISSPCQTAKYTTWSSTLDNRSTLLQETYLCT